MLDIADRLEPFWDRFMLSRQGGVEMRMHRPVPAEPALRHDKPWEGSFTAYHTVFRDNGICRMYYRGCPATGGDDASVTCYAESADGIEWHRPALGLVEFAGSKDNNILLRGDGSHAFAPFRDERPGVDPQEQYKALALRGGDKTPSRLALMALCSSDAIHWRKMQDEPVLTQGAFDSLNVAFWSHFEGRYVAYFRVYSESHDWREFRGKRTIARATSDDFIHWSEPAFMTFGEGPLHELYTNGTHPYFRAPHVYVALAKRFVKGRLSPISNEQIRDFGLDSGYAKDISEAVFMTSRGQNRYDWYFPEAFVTPGLDQANWTARSNMPACGMLQTGPAEMSVYVMRHYAQPSCYLERLTLRLDGLASLHAGWQGGWAVTRPFNFSGKSLVLNVSTAASGSVRVEIQDDPGRAQAGFALGDCDDIYGDSIERTVTWRGSSDLSALAGKVIRLRLELKDADVYSMRFV